MIEDRYTDSAAYTRGIRERLGMSQSEFGAAAKMTVDRISRYENGRRAPDYDAMRKYAIMEARGKHADTDQSEQHPGGSLRARGLVESSN